jgi:transcriptional regulator with XRE-family HTH domain
MAEKIGQIIKRIAESKGVTQQTLGEKVNRTKQGIASVYRRGTIDTDLLREISVALDYDFFSHFYDDPSLTKFKLGQGLEILAQLESLGEKLDQANKLIESYEELLDVQRKLIAKLEESVPTGK